MEVGVGVSGLGAGVGDAAADVVGNGVGVGCGGAVETAEFDGERVGVLTDSDVGDCIMAVKSFADWDVWVTIGIGVAA